MRCKPQYITKLKQGR